jgi:hypothetical protein
VGLTPARTRRDSYWRRKETVTCTGKVPGVPSRSPGR